jgi:hypothetical protein
MVYDLQEVQVLFMKEHAPQFKEAGKERCVYIMRVKADGTPIDLDVERGITLEEGEKLVIVVMNTDNMLIAYTKKAKSFVHNFEQILNKNFEAIPCEKVEYYMGMHVVRDRGIPWVRRETPRLQLHLAHGTRSGILHWSVNSSRPSRDLHEEGLSC